MSKRNNGAIIHLVNLQDSVLKGTQHNFAHTFCKLSMQHKSLSLSVRFCVCVYVRARAGERAHWQCWSVAVETSCVSEEGIWHSSLSPSLNTLYSLRYESSYHQNRLLGKVRASAHQAAQFKIIFIQNKGWRMSYSLNLIHRLMGVFVTSNRYLQRIETGLYKWSNNAIVLMQHSNNGVLSQESRSRCVARRPEKLHQLGKVDPVS